jgi:hypothetical protein
MRDPAARCLSLDFQVGSSNIWSFSGAVKVQEGRLNRLERLQKLRDAGVLDDPEFQSEKKRILAEGEQESPPRKWLKYAAFTAPILAGIAVTIWATEGAETPKIRSAPMQAVAKTNSAATVTAAAVPTRSEADRLAEAFEAATGHRSPFGQMEDGELVTTNPIRIIQLPFGPALLTKREIKDGCHACTGAIGIYYLREQGDRMAVTGRWPKAVEGWGWGAPPTNWHLTDAFTTYPAIYASGGFTGQGVTESSATVTELRPDGPITSDFIATGYTDEGSIVDNERPACSISGSISNIRKDRSFDVIITGSMRAIDHYQKRGGKFVGTSRIDWDLPCRS